MDNSRKKNVLFSWQRHDKNIINANQQLKTSSDS